MKFHLNRFLRRVRIHGGEFDTSARAMYRDEVVYPLQAEPRIVRGSTIERKQMSTKTTFKRVALVTVAALGLGVMSVAPSNAAAELDSISVSAASTTQVAGETLTATAVVVTASLAGKKGVDTLTVTATIVSGPAYIAPVLVFKESTTAVVGGTSPAMTVTPAETATVNQGTAKWSLYLDAPSVAGTYVVKLTPTGGVNAVSTTVSIVVSAKTLGWKTAFIGTGTTAVAADTTTAVLTYSALPSTTAKANIEIKQGYGATAGSNLAANADAQSVVVTTDKGLISKSTLTYADSAKSISFPAATLATSQVYIYSNGDVGAASITVTVNGVLLSTKTVTFTGAAASLAAATTVTAATPLWVTLGTAKTTVVTAKDSAASTVTVPTGLTVKSSDTAVATVAIHATDGTVTVTPVAAGNATVTVTDPATSAAATAVTFPITVAPVKSKVAPAITFDKSAYNVGELVTMTISSVMGDSATATLFTAALVSSAAVVASGTAHTGTTHAVAGGKVTYKFYAPAVSGAWTITGTTGADVDLATAATVTAGFDIVNAAVDAATTAAEAAEAAAQDATDAALDATTAAEAAGALAQEAVDLVTELSAEVTKLIAGVRASITYLTKLVMKLAAKK